MPEPISESVEQLDLIEVSRRLRTYWRVIALIALSGAIVAAIVSFILPPEFESSVTMSVNSGDEEYGKLQGLANIASNFNVLEPLGLGGSSASSRRVEAVATLKSRILTDAFINQEQLMPVLFASRWDKDRNTWKAQDPEQIPTLWDAYKKFDRRIRTVSEDKKTGIVMLTIAWKDKHQAAAWANDLVTMANGYLRQKALDRSERNLAYLNDELKKTTVVELQKSIYNLIEVEIKKTMLAKGDQEYAFKVIDPAVIAKERSRPKRTMLTALGFIAGAAIGAVWASMFAPYRTRRVSVNRNS